MQQQQQQQKQSHLNRRTYFNHSMSNLFLKASDAVFQTPPQSNGVLDMPIMVTSQDHLFIDNSTFNTSRLLLHAMDNPLDNNQPGQKFLFEESYMTVLVACIATLMSLVTIIGNVLVITAFIIDKNLRKYSNYFILNLSIADLLIGLLIPPYAPFMLYNYNWMLGSFLCTMWLVLDYVVGSASVLCIVVISLDRYWMVSRGLKYLSNQKISHAIFIMLTVWSIAFMNYAPAIIFWEVISPNSNKTISETECQVGFHDNLGYLTATACVEFFLPFISICSLNLAVYFNIRKRSKGLIRTKVPVTLGPGKLNSNDSNNPKTNRSVSTSGFMSTSGADHRKSSILNVSNTNNVLNTSVSSTQSSEHLNNSDNSRNGNNNNKSNLLSVRSGDLASRSKSEDEIVPLSVTWKNTDWRANSEGFVKKDKNLSKDKKAARSLFILVFTFVVCWVSG